MARPMDLEAGPLFRASLVRAAEDAETRLPDARRGLILVEILLGVTHR
jgi:hypothetical protein